MFGPTPIFGSTPISRFEKKMAYLWEAVVFFGRNVRPSFVRLGRLQADEGLGIGVPLCSILVQVGNTVPTSDPFHGKERKAYQQKTMATDVYVMSVIFLLGDVFFSCFFVLKKMELVVCSAHIMFEYIYIYYIVEF